MSVLYLWLGSDSSYPKNELRRQVDGRARARGRKDPKVTLLRRLDSAGR